MTGLADPLARRVVGEMEGPADYTHSRSAQADACLDLGPYERQNQKIIF